jgi:hypothetical protein
MIVSELIIALQKLPQDATVIACGRDYPEVVENVAILKRKSEHTFYDGYYYPEFGTNPNVVIKI